MKLSQSQIDYVLYHLGMLIEIDEIKKYFRFGRKVDSSENCLYFPLSEAEFEIEKVIWVEESIPVLFPLGDKKTYYQERNGSIIFEHDLLRSVFYLLSGEQEYKKSYTEPFNRFSWEESVQKKLGITEKPIVNYYFEIIARGIEQFCEIHNLKFIKKGIFEKPVLFMSHDIDRIKCYNFARVKKYLKQFDLINTLRVLRGMIFCKEDPWWNFDYIMEVERKYGVNSSWYFLGKGLKHLDAYYSYKEEKIRKVIGRLQKAGHETGIHGTIRSANGENVLSQQKKGMLESTRGSIIGIRQHWLNYYPGKTARLQVRSGLRYDASLGFHDHIGFRNSYCLPFKLYDFENDKPFDIWELPLVYMDGSAFDYMKISEEELEKRIEKMRKEVKEFSGVFSILIHNNFIGHMKEELRKQREYYYNSILKAFTEGGYVSLTGESILNIIDRKKKD